MGRVPGRNYEDASVRNCQSLDGILMGKNHSKLDGNTSMESLMSVEYYGTRIVCKFELEVGAIADQSWQGLVFLCLQI